VHPQEGRAGRGIVEKRERSSRSETKEEKRRTPGYGGGPSITIEQEGPSRRTDGVVFGQNWVKAPAEPRFREQYLLWSRGGGGKSKREKREEVPTQLLPDSNRRHSCNEKSPKEDRVRLDRFELHDGARGGT